ncbi:short-chain alcohol dehydrogenase, putative [Ixodes scapularis]|uniref:(3R)-3-hydroxyacyl-CoA dehydrogenase n=1 Tax=Ixodes scapularis TaxID=6945 RepID=B7PX50_IXOSC|nr:short-chain alcohol dehydrogenase, putative [Ixodes scapularis]|eukprot:XP_002410516.1 short-chain alcohol dehydrogenase, putative [Ixodes scapularis]
MSASTNTSSAAARLALVTGGGSGIGKSVCHALASDGTHVIVADLNLDAATATASSLPGSQQHHAFKVDVGCSASVKSLFRDIQKTFARPPNVVVNCAGIAIPATAVVDTTEEDFDQVIRVNLKGSFLVTQAAGRAMIADKVTDGAIVNMSSMMAKIIHNGECAYSASKAGIVALTKVAAKELASYGVRVNVVLPSLITTPLSSSCNTSEFLSQVSARIPLGRAGLPEEVAEAVKFLCSSRSSFMTGSAVDVSGGV